MNLNERRRNLRWLPLIIVILLSILFMALDRAGNLTDALRFITEPSANAMAWLAARSDAFADSLGGPRDLQTAREQIDELQRRIDALEQQNRELLEIQGEYQLLLQLFDRVNQAPDLTRVIADVVAEGPSPYFRDIVINRGTDDGVRVGMPVESAQGLVGQVFRTTPNASLVLLVADDASFVPARLSASRATGIVNGAAAGDLLLMDWVNLEARINVGEIVVTSGVEGASPQAIVANRFPPNIVIGRVIDVERSEAALFQRAIVQPAVNLDALETVFVITDFEPVDPSVFDIEAAP